MESTTVPPKLALAFGRPDRLDPLIPFIARYFPSVVDATPPLADAADLDPIAFPTHTYADDEKAEIRRWVAASEAYIVPPEDETKHLEALRALNEHLSTRTTILSSKPSAVDLAVFSRLAPTVAKWTPEQRTGEHGHHHIIRYIDFVQNSPIFGISLRAEDTVDIDPSTLLFVPKLVDPKEEKERKKKEKALAADAPVKRNTGQGGSGPSKGDKAKEKLAEAASTVTGGAIPSRPKKEKAPKAPKAAPVEKALSPSQIDLRVGHIIEAVAHPNADSLYVSTIACGDAPGADNTSVHEASGQTVRTVCSGLNGLVPLAEMQGRKVVVVCNLKPVTMRGIKSAAMVLAASPRSDNAHAGPVELVSPPADSTAGERVSFEGHAGDPEAVLNPKKKVWETCQAGFTTTEAREVAFDEARVEGLGSVKMGAAAGVRKLHTASGGVCTVKTLTGATVR
ncbi:MAG: G4 quadruplex nucleic acid binding protein [Thelocarpon impressellum]|nr:MAG: G4 quadruplex nucleic acid binding protein [Thelocarpon impressellum]